MTLLLLNKLNSHSMLSKRGENLKYCEQRKLQGVERLDEAQRTDELAIG